MNKKRDSDVTGNNGMQCIVAQMQSKDTVAYFNMIIHSHAKAFRYFPYVGGYEGILKT